MKKYLIILMLLIVILENLQAQRMMPKQKAVEFSAGVLSNSKPTNNYFLNLALNIFENNGNYWLFSAEYNQKYVTANMHDIPLENYLGELGYSLRVWSDHARTFNLNATLTGVLGYQTINRDEKLRYDGSIIRNDNSFVYGPGGRLSLETYLSDHIVLLVQGKSKVLWGSSTNLHRPSAGIGLRFNF